MSKKVYLYKDIRVELGLDPGYTYDENENLVPYIPSEEKDIEERESNECTDSNR